jgi:nitric oxide reductase NorE protein
VTTGGRRLDDRREELPEFLSGTDEEPARPRHTEPAAEVPNGRVPGETGLWVFVLGDMTVFAALMVMMMRQRHADPTLVADSAEHLMPGAGFLNTLVLLLSSYLVVRALHAHRRDDHSGASRFIVSAIACAVAFAIVKGVEYTNEIGAGFTPTTNVFFNYYFGLTGLHLVHVTIGSVLLGWWLKTTRRQATWSTSRRTVEGIAVYWHMVDLLWIAIFTLAYLVCPQ